MTDHQYEAFARDARGHQFEPQLNFLSIEIWSVFSTHTCMCEEVYYADTEALRQVVCFQGAISVLTVKNGDDSGYENGS